MNQEEEEGEEEGKGEVTGFTNRVLNELREAL